MSRGDEPTNVFQDLHDVTLQRLDVYQLNGGKPTFYDSQFFAPTANLWDAVPVVYVETEPGKAAEHPNFADVSGGTLPPQYRVVGNVSNSAVSQTGERVLNGAVGFTDPEIEGMASRGELSLSTGFASPISPDPYLKGAVRISGNVIPNHVLVFRRGACPNCYPNDAGALFHNLKEKDMPDDETKGLLKKIADALTKAPETPTQHNNLAEIENLKKELETAKAQTEELTNLKKELATLKEEKAKSEKDAKWATMKNALPAGWLGEKEAATRKEYEADPGAFALKLIAFKNTQPAAQGAEGSGVSGSAEGAEASDEAQFKNLAAKFAEKTGIRVI